MGIDPTCDLGGWGMPESDHDKYRRERNRADSNHDKYLSERRRADRLAKRVKELEAEVRRLRASSVRKPRSAKK